MWDLPGLGLQPVSPALADGFLTTAPPGKPLSTYFYIIPGFRGVEGLVGGLKFPLTLWILNISVLWNVSYVYIVLTTIIFGDQYGKYICQKVFTVFDIAILFLGLM